MRLTWWGAGLVAAGVAYATFGAGFLAADAASDPNCGLPGLEVLLVLAAILGYPALAFLSGAWASGVRGWRWAWAIGVTLVAVPASFVELGPTVYPGGRCGEPGPRMLGGFVVTGVAAALYAWLGRSARKPSTASATR